MVECPICSKPVKEALINRHIDTNCTSFADEPASPPPTQQNGTVPKSSQVASFFRTPGKRAAASLQGGHESTSSPAASSSQTPATTILKRTLEQADHVNGISKEEDVAPAAKKPRASPLDKVAPLAERMRPRTLDEVHGQELVGPGGVIRSLIEADRVPSMILWGGPGTGKTTIARLIAQTAGTRFVEINSTSTGVGECKKLFTEARNELSLTGRKTIIFCDEIHRFSKSQQDVFLAPVEAGTITLIGATTENPSFKVVNALLSRCRTFTLAQLTDDDVLAILRRALVLEPPESAHALALLEADSHGLLKYLSTFASGDARTGLNLLSLALSLAATPNTTIASLKASLTQTLVYDRSGDQHYDTISAFHKSVRGSDPDAALYYLARMLQSGEDPLYIARRMLVIASEDVGLADNSLLPLASAAYACAEKIGMPECRINLAHCAVALALAPKSTRSYRGLAAAVAALREPGVAALPVPVHLRNAPTRLMKELGYGRSYKYNPDYVGGRVVQEYLPEGLVGRKFLGEVDFGEKVDEELVEPDEDEDKGKDKKKMVERSDKHTPEADEKGSGKPTGTDDPVRDTAALAAEEEDEEEMLLNPDGE